MKLFTITLIFIYTLALSPAAKAYPGLSPYQYCAGDPVNFTDPTGCIIQGVTKTDAEMAVADFRAMFPGDVFNDFRNLIVQSGKNHNGKSLAPISEDALSAAFEGITLNVDQQALVEMVVNTINSNDLHIVEYRNATGILTDKGKQAFLPGYLKGELAPHMPIILEANNGLPIWLIRTDGGDGATTRTNRGSHSVIVIDGEHFFGRALTTGHEIIGHGRSLAIGRGDENQHIDAIQTDNLIRRVMGIPFIHTGEGHGNEKYGGPFPECTLMPCFR